MNNNLYKGIEAKEFIQINKGIVNEEGWQKKRFILKTREQGQERDEEEEP